MKKLILLLWAAFIGSSAWAQDGQQSPNTSAAQRDPHIVNPTPSGNVNPPDAPILPYHFFRRAALPNGMKTTLVSGAAITPEGHSIFLTRNPAAMLLEFDKEDRFVRTFDPNIAIGPHGLRIDVHGNIWVTDSFLNVVWKLDPRGEPIFALGERGASKPWSDNEWNNAFNQPLDVAFDKDDNFYVVQGHGGTSNPLECTFCMTYAKAKANPTQGSDPRIFKFDKDGNYLMSRALPHADGTYPTIHSVIVTPKGEIWLSDRQLQTIKVFDTSLKPLREMKEPYLVSGLFVDGKGVVWMSAGMDGRILELADDGKILGWLGGPGRSDANSPLIGEAHYVAVTPDEKTIYLADSINGKILEWKHD